MLRVNLIEAENPEIEEYRKTGFLLRPGDSSAFMGDFKRGMTIRVFDEIITWDSENNGVRLFDEERSPQEQESVLLNRIIEIYKENGSPESYAREAFNSFKFAWNQASKGVVSSALTRAAFNSFSDPALSVIPEQKVTVFFPELKLVSTEENCNIKQVIGTEYKRVVEIKGEHRNEFHFVKNGYVEFLKLKYKQLRDKLHAEAIRKSQQEQDSSFRARMESERLNIEKNEELLKLEREIKEAAETPKGLFKLVDVQTANGFVSDALARKTLPDLKDPKYQKDLRMPFANPEVNSAPGLIKSSTSITPNKLAADQGVSGVKSPSKPSRLTKMGWRISAGLSLVFGFLGAVAAVLLMPFITPIGSVALAISSIGAGVAGALECEARAQRIAKIEALTKPVAKPGAIEEIKDMPSSAPVEIKPANNNNKAHSNLHQRLSAPVRIGSSSSLTAPETPEVEGSSSSARGSSFLLSAREPLLGTRPAAKEKSPLKRAVDDEDGFSRDRSSSEIKPGSFGG